MDFRSLCGVWLIREWARNMEDEGRNWDAQPRLLALITGKSISIDLLWSMWWRQGGGQNQVLRIWGWWWRGGGMLTNSSCSESQECVVLCVCVCAFLNHYSKNRKHFKCVEPFIQQKNSHSLARTTWVWNIGWLSLFKPLDSCWKCGSGIQE